MDLSITTESRRSPFTFRTGGSRYVRTPCDIGNLRINIDVNSRAYFHLDPSATHIVLECMYWQMKRTQVSCQIKYHGIEPKLSSFFPLVAILIQINLNYPMYTYLENDVYMVKCVGRREEYTGNALRDRLTC